MFFFAILIINAQDDKLFDYQWKLEKIVTESETFIAEPYPPYAGPEESEYEQIYFDEYMGFYSFTFGYYGNGIADNLIFNDVNLSFHISDFYNHLGGYSTSEAFFSEEFIYDDPYQMTIHNPFSYDFRYEGDMIYLDITNDIGSIATFFDNFLNQQVFFKHSISIYPNPSSDYVNIEIKNQSIAKVSIFDMSGKLVLEKNNISNTQISVGNLNKGVYIIKIETSKGLFQEKLIKN